MFFSEEKVRKGIQALYERNPEIHISVSQTRPKVVLKNAKVTIVGVYLHIFCIEECTRGILTRHSIRYADILSNSIQIAELNLQ